MVLRALEEIDVATIAAIVAREQFASTVQEITLKLKVILNYNKIQKYLKKITEIVKIVSRNSRSFHEPLES